MSQTVIFRDMFDRSIKVGDWIVLSNSGRGGTLYTAKVAGFKKSRMYITKVHLTWRNTNTYTERFNECIIVPEESIPINVVLKSEPEYSQYVEKFA